MPYVNVKVAGDLSEEQKQAIVEGVSELMEKVANKPKSATYVVIDEISRDNWGKNGELLSRG